MSDSADPIPSQPPPGPSAATSRPDPDMPPRKAPAGGKLRKPLTDKQRAVAGQRLERLRARLVLRLLDGPSPRVLQPPHEDALRALGLLDFARHVLAADAPRPDLVAPLIAYYDPACKRSFVRGVRVAVSRSDLTRALSLPPKAASSASAAPPDVDPAVVVPAVMQLLRDCILLPFQGDDMCILPQEVAAAEQAVREGSAHRVDWAGLIWGLVEKEMLELPNRDDCVCHYGPHLQRLIRSQKPNLFELVEEGDRGEIAPEASVDVEMEEEDEDADVKSKADDVAGADAMSHGREEPELGNADARINGLDELGLGNTNARDTILEESESGVNVRSREMDEMECVNEESRINGLGESEAVDEDERRNSLDESEAGQEYTKAMTLEDERRNSLDESEAGQEYTKAMTLDESDNEDRAKGENLDELSLGLEAAQAMHETHDMVPADNEDALEAAPERGDDVAAPAAEVGEGSLADTVVRTQMEMVAVPEEAVDEDAEGEEDKDTTGHGLSLGISSTNGYDSVDLDEENAENLDEGDSGNEELEESEDDDAFEECKDEDDMNWRIGDGKDDSGMTHSLQRGNSSAFGSMQFENLNKGDVEMRDELRFDDFHERGSLERMTSSNLLQAMNSIPASYNVTDNVHDLSTGDFLAMGADAHKNGMDLGPGSSYLFGNSNGKRNIGDIDGYNSNMQVQEQFPQCNQQKRMRHTNSSGISPGPSDFNANFMVPMQNLMVQAKKLYEQKDQEVQSLQMEKQYFADMLQEKESLIQSLNSARFEQQNRWQAQLRRFENDLNVMAQLVTSYKKALKQTQASFTEYKKKFPCNKPRYDDVPDGGGLVVTVKELEIRQLEIERQKVATANDMINKFELEWFSRLKDSMSLVHSLSSRMENLSREIHLIKETRKARFEAPPSEK